MSEVRLNCSDRAFKASSMFIMLKLPRTKPRGRVILNNLFMRLMTTDVTPTGRRSSRCLQMSWHKPRIFHKLRPNLLFGDIWAKLGKRLRQLLCERPCCPTACAIGARRVVAVFIRLNKDLRGKTLRRSSRTEKKKKSRSERRVSGCCFYSIFFKTFFFCAAATSATCQK